MLGYIYIIRSKQTDKVYIGSTFYTLKQRLSGHKCNKKCTSVEILKYGDATIELLESYECENKEQLERREGQYQRQYNCVNKHIAGRTKKEYRQDNKETIAEKNKEYLQQNKEARAEYEKKYYQKNKEKINEKRKEKFTCECGGRYTHQNKTIHLKSKKHQDYFKD